MGSWNFETRLYFDANATHPLLPAVAKGLSQLLLNSSESLLNPSSIHQSGQKAKELLAEARLTLASELGLADPEDLIFTSGATESLHSIVKGFLQSTLQIGRKPLILSSPIEHAAVLESLQNLKAPFSLVKVNSRGDLDEAQLESFFSDLQPESDLDILCIFQAANNELGTIYRFEPLLEKIQNHRLRLTPVQSFRDRANPLKRAPDRIFLAIDAAQALGKMESSFLRKLLLVADFLALSAHKMGAPSGIGALCLKKTARWSPVIFGGKQERRRRGGTHNILGIAGWLLALKDWKEFGDLYRSQMRQARDFLLEELVKIPGLRFHGDVLGQRNLPNTLNFYVEGMEDESLVLAFDMQGIRVSSGSACNSGSLTPSHVLMALGCSREEALGSVRVSLPAGVTLEQAKEFVDCARELVARIRASQKYCEKVLPGLGFQQNFNERNS